MEKVGTNTIKCNSRWNLFKENIKTVYQYPWQKITNQDIPIHKKIGFGFLGVAEIIGIGITATIAGGFAVFHKPLSQRKANTHQNSILHCFEKIKCNIYTLQQLQNILGNDLYSLQQTASCNELDDYQFHTIISRINMLLTSCNTENTPFDTKTFVKIYDIMKKNLKHRKSNCTNSDYYDIELTLNSIKRNIDHYRIKSNSPNHNNII